MPLLPLIAVAVIAMTGLAMLRLVRVRAGRTPLPEGRGRRFFFLAFVALPPLLLGALSAAITGVGAGQGILWLPVYAAIVGALAILMWIVARLIAEVSHTRSAGLARLALTGNAGDPPGMRTDTPLTATLAACVECVDGANAAFPRGPAFPMQIEGSGFRANWEALDGATRTLEARIADDRRLGLGVAPAAAAKASDARSRLEMLRHLAAAEGQAWAAE
jgi:hypothetical protein